MARSLLVSIYESQPVQIVIAIVIYGIYAAVLGVALAPSVGLLVWGASAVGFGGASWIAPVLLFSLLAGASVWLYFVWGSIAMALLIRLLSLGIKPGKYPKVSLTTLRWLIYSGIHTLAIRSILPYIAVGYFINLYVKLIGGRVGKNVYINTNLISDPYLLTLEDGVILGGNAEVTCHIMEQDFLILDEVKIGKNSLIGTGSYVSPGVTVGSRCMVGARSYLRRGVTIPDGTVWGVVGGLPMREVVTLEKWAKQRPKVTPGT